MISPLNFSGFCSSSLVAFCINSSSNICPVFSFLAFNKLPENPVVTPSTSVQAITPSSVNRYLQSVTVNATSTTTGA
jgi:hypothetical protein